MSNSVKCLVWCTPQLACWSKSWNAKTGDHKQEEGWPWRKLTVNICLLTMTNPQPDEIPPLLFPRTLPSAHPAPCGSSRTSSWLRHKACGTSTKWEDPGLLINCEDLNLQARRSVQEITTPTIELQVVNLTHLSMSPVELHSRKNLIFSLVLPGILESLVELIHGGSNSSQGNPPSIGVTPHLYWFRPMTRCSSMPSMAKATSEDTWWDSCEPWCHGTIKQLCVGNLGPVAWLKSLWALGSAAVTCGLETFV